MRGVEKGQRVLAIHRYYSPDTPPYATMLRSIVGQWSSDGYVVDVLTSQPSYKSAVANPKYPRRELADGVSITRLRLPNEASRPLTRLFNAVRLSLAVLWKAVAGRYDVIMISTSPPVVGGAVAALAARLTGARFIYHCMDVHPEIGRVSGEFSQPMVFRALRAIDGWTCRRADPVVVLSEDMATTIRSRPGCGDCRIEVLNNFSLPAEENVSETLPFDFSDGVFTILFAGNIGRFQGLDTLVDAIAVLRDRADIEIVLMGEGVVRAQLEAKVASLDVRVRFVGQQSVAVAKAAMRQAGAGFVSLVPGLYRYAYPSKTMTYLEQGCPLLVAVEPESQLALEVSEQGLGVCVPNGDAGALADAIRQLADAPESRASMRAAALRKVEEFSESAALARWSELLSRALEKTVLEDKIIVIGAPRSGTNMLRDAICSLDGFATWPCDEINAMWKHGHLSYPYDDLAADRATLHLSRFMKRKFDRLAATRHASTVVEKTCASSLRVAYLARLLPEARFVFIHRNGVDAVSSAVKRWRSRMDLPYTMRKLRFVPPFDIPAYGLRFIKNRMRQWSDSDGRLRAWGPMTRDIEAAGASGDIEKAAALQWQQCVEYSLDQFPSGAPVATVCYERFVAEPKAEMQRLVTALGYTISDAQISRAVANVNHNKSGSRSGMAGENGTPE